MGYGPKSIFEPVSEYYKNHPKLPIIHQAFNIIFNILPRAQGRTAPSELVGDFISLYPSISRDPVQPHSVSGRDIIPRLLALSYQSRRCFGSLECFQSRLAIRANTNIFLWPILSFNFINTG